LPTQPEGAPPALSALDWAVIVAATVALAVLVWWLVNGQPKPPPAPPVTPE
jgi:hypothetical protein